MRTSQRIERLIAAAPSGRGGLPHNRGFTLIELLIVVVIVAVLTAIALPSYQEQMRKSRRAQAKADLTELAQQLERTFTVDRSYAGFDLSTSGITQSPRDGHPFVAYAIALNNLAAKTYTLTATPSYGQTSDRCGVLTLDQTGVKTHNKDGGDENCVWGAYSP